MATKSTNGTIWTILFVIIAAIVFFKVILPKLKGGTASGGAQGGAQANSENPYGNNGFQYGDDSSSTNGLQSLLQGLGQLLGQMGGGGSHGGGSGSGGGNNGAGSASGAAGNFGNTANGLANVGDYLDQMYSDNGTLLQQGAEYTSDLNGDNLFNALTDAGSTLTPSDNTIASIPLSLLNLPGTDILSGPSASGETGDYSAISTQGDTTGADGINADGSLNTDSTIASNFSGAPWDPDDSESTFPDGSYDGGGPTSGIPPTGGSGGDSDFSTFDGGDSGGFDDGD
jgi:hypothetical protein